MDTFEVCEVLEDIDSYCAVMASEALRQEAFLCVYFYNSLETVRDIALSYLKTEIESKNRRTIAIWAEGPLVRSKYALKLMTKRRFLNDLPVVLPTSIRPQQDDLTRFPNKVRFSVYSNDKSVKISDCWSLNNILKELVTQLIMSPTDISNISIDVSWFRLVKIRLQEGHRTLSEDIAKRRRRMTRYGEYELVQMIHTIAKILDSAHIKVRF